MHQVIPKLDNHVMPPLLLSENCQPLAFLLSHLDNPFG